jgi:hypothetical protein
VFFEVDFELVGYKYSHRKCTQRSIKHSRMLWIYLHGIELEKEKDDKHWICKLCYEAGKPKIMVAISTASYSKHLATHNIYLPGVQPPGANGTNSTVDVYLEGVHPLHVERWREHFIDWIAYDDITFEQAASSRLRKVILGGGPQVQHLLPSARIVRLWLINTYYERFEDVRKCLASSRSKINLSFDI